jgi:hypothetical protein
MENPRETFRKAFEWVLVGCGAVAVGQLLIALAYGNVQPDNLCWAFMGSMSVLLAIVIEKRSRVPKDKIVKRSALENGLIWGLSGGGGAAISQLVVYAIDGDVGPVNIKWAFIGLFMILAAFLIERRKERK